MGDNSSPDLDDNSDDDYVNINSNLDLFRKRITINTIKYAPTALGIFCAVKLILLSCLQIEPNIVNIANVIMLSVILVVVYIQGKAFKFCDKHRNICYITFFGHCYYIAYCLDLVSFNLEATIIYSILLTGMTIIYYLQTKSTLI